MPGIALRSAVHRFVADRPGRTRSLLLVDLGVAVLLCGGLLFATSRSAVDPVGHVESSLRTAFTVLAAATVGFRRLAGRLSFVVATLSASVAAVLGAAPMVCLCIAFTAYTAATAGDYARWWFPPVVASAVIAVATGVGQVASWLGALIASVAVVCVGWSAGQAACERRDRLDAIAERQAERERQHAVELRQAAVDERLVIARELHDIVAHSMSVIAVRAGVARMVMDNDPVEVKETLGIIETTTRQALQEMRLLVEVLRQEHPVDATLTPAPGLADITALVTQIRRAGVELEVDIFGVSRPLPSGVDLSAYRIAQEALTNVVRHAGPTRATLRIEYRAEDLLIDVTDAGPDPATPRPSRDHRTAGHGLIGMGERVALFDGHLRTGRDGAGFGVHALLRTDESTS